LVGFGTCKHSEAAGWQHWIIGSDVIGWQQGSLHHVKTMNTAGLAGWRTGKSKRLAARPPSSMCQRSTCMGSMNDMLLGLRM